MQHPYRIAHALGYLEIASAKLAVILLPGISELVDRCLYVDSEWTWSDWDYMTRELRAVFERAGIGDRHVAFSFES